MTISLADIKEINSFFRKAICNLGICVLSRGRERFCHILSYHTPYRKWNSSSTGLLGHALHILCSRGVGGPVYLARSMARPCALTRNLTIDVWTVCAVLALLCLNSHQI